VTLTDRVIVITGATGGLGPTVVQTMADAGASVVPTGRRQEALDSLLKDVGLPDGRALAQTSDVTDADSLAALRDAALARFGQIDGLINIAGGYKSGSVLDVDIDTWNGMMALNALSVILACQAMVPHMVERGYGKVVNVSAQHGLHGHKRNVAYASAKSAVLRITESLSEEVRERGVNVNAVLPSTIDTPDNRKAFPKADHSKWVSPEEIAGVMRFLVSDEASAIHGAAIPVYGLAG
jgi:NAD(P)-dependent dehydrogenase (short-subunit alcohol dehydrogenase family)